MKKIALILISMSGLSAMSQEIMTPELLWKLGRISPLGISNDNKNIIYKVSTPSIDENKSNSKYYSIPINGGKASELKEYISLISDKNKSSDGKWTLSHKEVKINNTLGKDYYPTLDKSDVLIYDGLDYRHWDTYNNGNHNHVIITDDKNKEIDIMKNEPFDSPQKPFGGDEDYIWSPDGLKVIYVSKKKEKTAYAISTNTDLYEYNLKSGITKNLTKNNSGYDVAPQFSPNSDLSWLQMKRDGYEADKNDIIVRHKGTDINLTSNWDGTVDSFTWSNDGRKVYFLAPINGTKQLFEVNFPGLTKIAIRVKQITEGQFDINQIIGFHEEKVLVTRSDMNHANEIFSYNLNKKDWKQLTNINTEIYNNLSLPKIEKRIVKTTDGKDMLVWVILPPNFDAKKKYPTLLYCQGGPQGALSQFYSFRWNFQVMASQGYIVVAPNRRGMPGHGVSWNEEISKDWGGQAMDDYLSAIDDISQENYVDKTRLGAVGASYGGYSVFYLAGIHKNRFKTFIAHAGIFNTQSMYGTTEEVFFTNWDMGGAYWEKNNSLAQKAYNEFNPINLVNNWNTPIFIIQGAKDYRVPVGQSQEAFQAAQLKGIKSRFMLFPEENHWILKPQNGLVWQHEFFKWLKETL
ncbi:S9 family peptidase [Flavobacterium sediminilitoris]|uniref:S9 family peptidase n=1 Tax=Flavobacterium sediminilitoris TaxID=2024526 RepID=A0ABY4HQ32_9FLAO|nr:MULTISPECIES: S9 family peptidase [Flavobacterium]UOX34688.1 S9 family peptidase [Flavobacterium sediminilitoris]